MWQRPIMELRASTWFVFTILVLIRCYASAGNDERLRVCITAKKNTHKNINQEAHWEPVKRVIDFERFNCLKRLFDDEVDFTVLEPEDLIVATAYKEYNILVALEMRSFQRDNRFELVALIKKNIKDGWDIRDKRLCHPGLETKEDWTKTFSMYLENWIIPMECDNNKTLLENKISLMSNFFSTACIAGPWSPDPKMDNYLKSKYSNLCNGCDNPKSCSTYDKYYGREGALLCLTDNSGDIAWVRQDDIDRHFKTENIDKNDYLYLCPDGNTVSMDTPCKWISKPWPVVVARSQVVNRILKLLNTADTNAVNEYTWNEIMPPSENSKIFPVKTDPLTPEDYLVQFPGFMSAYRRTTCASKRVRWCVTGNLQNDKCKWLREAAMVYGVEPLIFCNQEIDTSSCLKAVASQQADIFVAAPHELYRAKKEGLKTVVNALSSRKNELNRIAAIVKYDSKFKTLKDLKGARACFTGYRSVGWNAFLSSMRNVTEEWKCADATTVSKFFRSSCVFGLTDEEKAKLPANLYSLCKRGESGNDNSVLGCLTSDVADVAFIDLKVVENITGEFNYGYDGKKKFRTLCVNESDYGKDPCLLTWTPLASVMVKGNITDLKFKEIYSMLIEVDYMFGANHKTKINAFSLYETYNNVPNVIFPGEVRYLESHDQGHIQKGRRYDEVLEDVLKQEACSAGNMQFSHFSGTFSLAVVLVSLSNKVLAR